MDFGDFVDWFKGDSRRELVENLSYCLIVIAAVMTVIGLGVGTVYPGLPVLVAIVGSFLALAGIVLYILSELVRIL
ncbi:MAG: hypothetical protein ACLFQ8_03285 [Candidatus Aenigmatarchaeota archaeon]